MNNLRYLILSDLKALHPSGNGSFLREYLYNRCFRVIVWYRITHYCKNNFKIIYFLARLIYSKVSRKAGIDLPVNVKIGGGFRIYHGYGLVINGEAIIGDNVTLLHGVTLGAKKTGAPTLGNNVYVGPGTVILGPVKIGNNVRIGANSFVSKDVPSDVVVAGSPLKIINSN